MKTKVIKHFTAAALSAMVMLTAAVTASAEGDVAGAVTNTWSSAKSQIKTVVDSVVFPVIDVVLAVLLFVKIGTAYLDYRKHGQSALPAVSHRRKSFYYSFTQELTHYKCRPDRLSQQLNEAYKNAQYKYLAECALAGSAFFMRVKDESKGSHFLKRKLVKSYRAYSDKGRKSVKQRALADKMKEVQSDLKQTARTQEQSLATAKKLFELADCAVKISVEEAMEQEQEEQTESEDQDLAPPVLC